jgi:anti-sigma factor (TIGR02949 family)
MMCDDHEYRDCQHLLDSLSDYVDGTLGEELCAEIEQHIADCEDCRIVINTLEKTIYLYHTSAEQDPPPIPEDVKARLFKRLDLEEFLHF